MDDNDVCLLVFSLAVLIDVEIGFWLGKQIESKSNREIVNFVD